MILDKEFQKVSLWTRSVLAKLYNQRHCCCCLLAFLQHKLRIEEIAAPFRIRVDRCKLNMPSLSSWLFESVAIAISLHRFIWVRGDGRFIHSHQCAGSRIAGRRTDVSEVKDAWEEIYLSNIYLCTVFLLANDILMELMELQPLSVYIRKGKTLCCSIMPQQKVLSIANVYHRLVLLSPGLGGNCRLHDVCL